MALIRQTLKKEVLNLVKQAGDSLLKEFKTGKQPKAFLKGKHDIVTKADLITEKIILNKLNKLTPTWRILSEEKGDNHKAGDYFWVVDPLDGTTNFYMGNPLFSTQIALIYKNEPILGIIYAPALNEFYYAEKNKGAFLNNKKIKVSKKTLNKAILTYCHGSHQKDINKALKLYQYFKKHYFDIRQLGSASIEFAWVAKGRTECYISPGENLWDIAPGILLVKEAGGNVYDFSGKPWQIKAKSVFVSNGVIDKAILKFLKTL